MNSGPNYDFESDWISVEDRLPDKDGRYLVAVKGYSEPIIKRWHNEMKIFTFINMADLKFASGLKEEYWMPLPKVPEAEDANS